jgi:hypothetical protein
MPAARWPELIDKEQTQQDEIIKLADVIVE